MPRLAHVHVAPVLFGFLALTGCPGDDASLDTEGSTGSTGTTGVVDPSTTVAPTSGATTIDPDSSGAPDTSTGSGPVCEPECGADECCVGGLCFDAPEPSCAPGCGEDELCRCPEGSDPCSCEAECVPDLGLCPGGWGEGNYADCLDDTGAGVPALCSAGATCVTDGDPAGVTVCAAQGCAEACDCPEPPGSGDAVVTCADVASDDLVNECYLSCEADETCPAGMSCFGGFICAWPVPQPVPGYHNCSLSGLMCQAGEDCLDDGDGMMVPTTWAVCSEPGCMSELDCQFDGPSTGEALVVCGDPSGMGGPNTCYLDCAMGEACPDGMQCTNDSLCTWAAGDTLFYDDFQTADFSMGWTLDDVDGQVPADDVAFIDGAWIVSDEYDGGPGSNLAAYSNSWYDPAGQADDWLISPQIMIGANAQVQWKARAQDPAYPDGYELRISTATTSIADFEANPPLFTIPNEVAGSNYTYRTVDLAGAGFGNQPIYLAWRNHSVDEFVLLVDEVAVVDFP